MPLSILAVDTESASLNLIRLLGTSEGHKVATFQDYQKAEQEGEGKPFDAAFVGMETIQPEGLALVRRLRESAFNRECTIVVMAATNRVADLRKAFYEGANLVLTKPVVARRIRPLLTTMNSPGWKFKVPARMPLFTEVKCIWDDCEFAMRSMNISESGMLLQPWLDVPVGQEVGLEFAIAEWEASLNVLARVVRKEENRSVGVEFIGLAPEDQNAIHLYVMGRPKEEKAARDLTGDRMRRLFDPYR